VYARAQRCDFLPLRLLLKNNRAAASPFKLISTFPAPDDRVRTLHDNWERAAERYPNVRGRGIYVMREGCGLQQQRARGGCALWGVCAGSRAENTP
jgi:hypothetical protein